MGKHLLFDGSTDEDEAPKLPRTDILIVAVAEKEYSFTRQILVERHPRFLDYLQKQQIASYCIPLYNVETSIFDVIHSFIERGRTKTIVPNRDVGKLMKAAKALNIDSLVVFLQHGMNSTVIHKNIFQTLQDALDKDDYELKRYCFDHIMSNLEYFHQQERFFLLPEYIMTEMLQINRPYCPEEIVFKAMLKWIKEKSPIPDTQTQLMGRIKPFICFPRMKTSFFRTCVWNTGILNHDERMECLNFFLIRHCTKCTNRAPVHNIHDNRGHRMICIQRFQMRGISSGKVYARDNEDNLIITTCQSLLLHGIFLFGSHQIPAIYQVQISLEFVDIQGRVNTVHVLDSSLQTDKCRPMVHHVNGNILSLKTDFDNEFILKVSNIDDTYFVIIQQDPSTSRLYAVCGEEKLFLYTNRSQVYLQIGNNRIYFETNGRNVFLEANGRRIRMKYRCDEIYLENQSDMIRLYIQSDQNQPKYLETNDTRMNLHTDGNRRIYQINVDPPVRLARDTAYTIRMLMKGMPSYFGIDGAREVTDEGITVKFATDITGLNGTTETMGQFPGFLFKRC